MLTQKEFTKLSKSDQYILYVNNYNELDGSGLLDTMIKNGYINNVKKVIDTYSNNIVKQLVIVRTPLDKYTEMALNATSLFHFNKTKNRNNYDDYFHLHLNVVLDNGITLTVEKNEVINIAKGNQLKSNSQTMMVKNTPPNTTLKQLMDRTQIHQGPKYFLYQASSNNCQYFIKDLLLANGVSDPAYIEFVKQDTESIFKNSPFFRKLATTATDLGAVVQNVQQYVPNALGHTLMHGLPIERPVNRFIRSDIAKPIVKNVTNTVNRTTKSIKKFFGGEINYNSLKVKELKEIIKNRKKEFNHKVTITGLTKKQLINLLNELK